jgi:hypothetical protein
LQTPIKNLKNKTNSVSVLKTLIPKGTIVGSYPFYDGNIEFKLAESDRFVIGMTQSRAVAEFWHCVIEDSSKISLIAEKLYSTLNNETFDILRKGWYNYKDPYVRSALFFLLNRCSALGMVSHGEFDTKNYNAIALRNLRSFQLNNFNIQLVEEYDYSKTEINLFSPGRYHFDVLDIAEPKGIEESHFKHTKFLKSFKSIPSIFLYEFHPKLPTISGYQKILIDKYGRETNSTEHAKEIILHNVR